MIAGMQRRDFIRIAGLAAAAGRLGGEPQQSFLAPTAGPQDVAKTDFTLRISPVTVELAPNRIISTIGYNGSAPGPLLRMKEGVPVTLNVINDTDVPETVHPHGLLIPSDVDGSEEEGTPPVPPHGSRRYQFTPTPAGTRWYHTHTMSMEDLHRGSYTGMFGFLVIEGANNPGNFDQEHFLALRDWEPYFTNQAMDNDDLDSSGPQPEKPAVMDTRQPGMEVAADIFSINDKALGAGEPIRVKPGDRVLFHFLNASAIENRHLALPGHKFNVIALDGNPVPTPAAVDVLMLGPGERIDAIVEMNQPGVWIIGAPEDPVREGGLGIVIEYANQRRTPQWILFTPPSARFFGRHAGQVADGGSQVELPGHPPPPAGHDARPAHDQRHADGLLVHAHLLEHAVAAEHLAMVAGDDQHAAVQPAGGPQAIQQPADAIVEQPDHAEVDGPGLPPAGRRGRRCHVAGQVDKLHRRLARLHRPTLAAGQFLRVEHLVIWRRPSAGSAGKS